MRDIKFFTYRFKFQYDNTLSVTANCLKIISMLFKFQYDNTLSQIIQHLYLLLAI